MVLFILQWNARSLIANSQEFKKYISDSSFTPQVICIQETWLKPHLKSVLQGYSAVRRDRKVGNGGGVVTFIKDDVAYKQVNVKEECESVIVEVWTGSQKVRVINFHNPCERLTNLGGEGSHKEVWCGDFNAHSSLWGSMHTNHNRRAVEELLELRNLVCINDGSYTRLDISKSRYSAIDLTIMSECLAKDSMWKVFRK